MQRVFLYIALLLLLPSSISAQALNEAFLNSTVLISYVASPTASPAGSGFLVFKELKPKQGHIILVTNKHVLPSEGVEKSINIRVNIKSGSSTTVKLIQIPIVGKDGKYLPTIKMHPKSGYDIGVVNITEQVLKESVSAEWLPLELFVTKEKLKAENITVGDEIFLLGYPASIFDPRNVFPILREGVIATVPSQGYAFNDTLKKQFGLPDQIDGFLIDASVFPGSSGSVVILKPQATTIGSQGETVVSSNKKIPYVLGIVSGSIPIADVALGSVQRMGLGVVYSADAIKEAIDQLYPKTP
ncbi:MAG: serine protease [Pyrinomonadaceae bacterium]